MREMVDTKIFKVEYNKKEVFQVVAEDLQAAQLRAKAILHHMGLTKTKDALTLLSIEESVYG